MVSEKIKEYKNSLETRVRTFKELSKRGRWISNFGFLLSFSGIAIFFLVFLLTEDVFTPFISFFVMFLVGIFLVFLGTHVIVSKGVPRYQDFYLSSDEKIFLKIFDALTFFEAHLHRKLEPARYQCLNELREAYGLMEEYWVPTGIKVILKEIGSEIQIFKEKFDENLIYSLERGTKTETVQEIYDILSEFGEYLIDPSKEKLVELNKRMDSDSLLHLETTRPRYPIVDFLKKYKIQKHAIVVGLIVLCGVVPSLIGLNYGAISSDSAIIVFATISGPSIAVYLGHVLRKR